MRTSAGELLDSINVSQHQDMLARMTAFAAPGTGAETLAGGLLSRGAAIGAPVMSAGMSLLGLDPISLGLRAGSFAWGKGAGVLGAGLAGMGAMAGAGIVGAGVSFAGHQMYSGAEQQLQLNRAMRQNFNFMNNQGGMGFTSQQGFQIGSQLRGMEGAIGLNGEVATFGELSRLASNMGRMGMAQNVRTVQEFKEKFKQMVDTLKTVAHDMGTSLEEAQKMMNSMKSSGVFNKADVLKMSAGIRSTAMAGNLAMSEVSGAANIGSQIARSVGGLGRQGAFAGIKTMEQIGIAQKVGAITEEDIYNATGMTGAEGRQALAAAQMQQSANFFRSSRGRYFLASVAGKDGTLNMDAVNEWMAGGDMTTGRTAELARKNLSGVGRANFIRNEGRLRGAALQQFGGLAQSVAYKQWLSSRGYDPTSMDDTAMLAFQRFSGLGRDEADVAIKEVLSIPEQLRESANTERGMAFSDQMTKQRSKQGIEGLKRKIDETRAHIQGKLQGVGARLLQSFTNDIESTFNNLMGIYVDVSTEGINEIGQRIENGGPGALADARRYFGTGIRSGGGGPGGVGIGQTVSDVQKFARNQSLQFGAMAGTRDKDVIEFAKNNADMIRLATLSTQGESGEAVTNRLRERIAAMGSKDGKAMAEKLANASPGQLSAITQTMQEVSGSSKDGYLLNALQRDGANMFSLKQSAYTSIDDYREALGRQVTGIQKDKSTYEKLAEGDTSSSGVGGLGGFDPASGGSGEGFLYDYFANKGAEAAGKNAYIRGAGDVIRDKDMLPVFADLAVGGEATKNAESALLSRIGKMRGNTKYDELTKEDRGGVDTMAAAYVRSKFSAELGAASSDSEREAVQKKMISAFRDITGSEKADQQLSDKDVLGRVQAAGDATASAVYAQQEANFQAEFKRLSSGVQSDLSKYKQTGYLNADGTLNAKSAAERANMPEAQRNVMNAADALIGRDITQVSDEYLNKYLEKNGKDRAWFDSNQGQQDSIRAHAAYTKYMEDRGNLMQDIAGMSPEQQREVIRSGGPAAGFAAQQVALQDRFRSLGKGRDGKQDPLRATSRLLGMNLSEDELTGINAGKSVDEKVQRLLAAGGYEDKSGRLAEDLRAAFSTKDKGKLALGVQQALDNSEEVRKKRLEAKEAEASQDPRYQVMKDIRDSAKNQEKYLQTIAANSGTTPTNAEPPPKPDK